MILKVFCVIVSIFGPIVKLLWNYDLINKFYKLKGLIV